MYYKSTCIKVLTLFNLLGANSLVNNPGSESDETVKKRTAVSPEEPWEATRGNKHKTGSYNVIQPASQFSRLNTRKLHHVPLSNVEYLLVLAKKVWLVVRPPL